MTGLVNGERVVGIVYPEFNKAFDSKILIEQLMYGLDKQ